MGECLCPPPEDPVEAVSCPVHGIVIRAGATCVWCGAIGMPDGHGGTAWLTSSLMPACDEHEVVTA